jgi:DnaK suppressor protein
VRFNRKTWGNLLPIRQARIPDTVITASLAYGREFSMGLAERQTKYLEQIDEALQRIEDGSYGICLVTGEPISVERLNEVPVAKYSVKGKEIMEKRKQKGQV